MSDFNKNMAEALAGGGQFDPERARAAQKAVYDEHRKQLKTNERTMWLLVCVLCCWAAYAAGGFAMQASTAKGWIGYGLAVVVAFVVIIQKSIIFSIAGSQIAMMKEIKQLRLAVAGGSAAIDAEAARPLRGCSKVERAAWTFGLMALAFGLCHVGMITNRQDDVWRIQANERVEAHQTLTLRRFPHEIHSFTGIKPPVADAVMQSATFNGKPVTIGSYATDTKGMPIYQIQLPYRLGWTPDKLELVWNFGLPREPRLHQWPLRSMIPVHAYSLTLYVEDGSEFSVVGDTWKFNKSPEELKDEAEARRTVKAFTSSGDAAQDDFGACRLALDRKK